MSLIICQECGASVSSQAEGCQRCGCPVAPRFDVFAQNDALMREISKNNEGKSPYSMAREVAQRTGLSIREAEEVVRVYKKDGTNLLNVPREEIIKKYVKKKDSNMSIWALVLSLFGCTYPIAFILALVDLSKNDKETKHGGSWFALVAGIIYVIWIMAIFPSDEKVEDKLQMQVQTETVTDNQSEDKNVYDEEIAYEESSKEESEDVVNVSEKEILFRELPWGSSYPEVEKQLGELTFMPISGEDFQTPSVDAVLLGDYEGLDFEYSDINLIATSIDGEIEVAGYRVEQVSLYFAYTLVDDILTKDEKDTSFYGARYIVKPQDLYGVKEDLVSKITTIYGEPSSSVEDTDIYDNQYSYTAWVGKNNTSLVLKTRDATNDTTDMYDNEITIAYACYNGDVDLQAASDALKQQEVTKEKENMSNETTEGL